MQQLQSLYRGDSSPSLAQIFGMQYQPQAATSQMANTALASGMSAGAQVKTTAMNNATQMAIADANRFENRRQFNLTNRLTNQLYNRNASENERHNLATEANADRVTAWNTGGSIDATDKAAAGDVQAQIMEMQMALEGLDKTDPDYDKKAAMISGRIKTLQAGANKAARTRGGLTGFAPRAGNMYGKNDSFTTEGGPLVTAAGEAGKKAKPAPVATPAAGPAAKPASGWPSGIATDHVVRDSNGYTLPPGTTGLFPSSTSVPTLSGSLGVLQRIYGTPGGPLGTISMDMTGNGQPITGTITQGVAAPAAATPSAPAATSPSADLWGPAGPPSITPTTLTPSADLWGNPTPAGITPSAPIVIPW